MSLTLIQGGKTDLVPVEKGENDMVSIEYYIQAGPELSIGPITTNGKLVQIHPNGTATIIYPLDHNERISGRYIQTLVRK